MPLVEERKTTKQVGVMFTCRTCKSVSRIDLTRHATHSTYELNGGMRTTTLVRWDGQGFHMVAESGLVMRCKCGGRAHGTPIQARASDTKCGTKCTNAKGHVCECECVGANHGKGAT